MKAFIQHLLKKFVYFKPEEESQKAPVLEMKKVLAKNLQRGNLVTKESLGQSARRRNPWFLDVSSSNSSLLEIVEVMIPNRRTKVDQNKLMMLRAKDEQGNIFNIWVIPTKILDRILVA